MTNSLRILFDPILPDKDKLYSWLEWQFIFLFFLGLTFFLADVSFKVSVIITLIAGLMFGRLLYRWNGRLLPYFVFICVGFLFGYVLFSPQKLFLIATYFAGVLAAYQLHKNKVVESVEW